MDNKINNNIYDDDYYDLYDAMDEGIYGIAEVEVIEPERINGYLVSDIELCLQAKTEYYLERFRKQPERDLNWSAFLFGGTWMAYRHMWREAVITYLLIIPAVLALIPLLIKIGIAGGYSGDDVILTSTFVIQFFFCVLYGLWSDTLYWRKIKRELNRFNRKDSTVSISEEEKENLLKRTNLSAMYVFAAMGINWILNWALTTLSMTILYYSFGIL